jgi:nitrogenase subunit NifH
VPELERSIGTPAVMAIPSSRIVAQSVNVGKSAIELNPLDPASVALQLLAHKLETNFEIVKPRSMVSYLRPMLNAKWVVSR